MVEKPKKLQPAIIGGVVIGVLSIIPVSHLCCCLWAIAGGILAAYLLIKRSPVLPVTNGDGAMVGALAGVVASIVALVINVPLSFIFNTTNVEGIRQMAENMDPSMRESVIRMAELMDRSPLLFVLIGWLISSVIFLAFATLGGILGVAMFEKRKGQPPPPQSPYGSPGTMPPGFAPPGPPPGGPQPPPGQPPYGGGEPPPY